MAAKASEPWAGEVSLASQPFAQAVEFVELAGEA